MFENFKINCKEINRQIKITLYVPDHYYKDNEEYSILYVFDGQNAFFDEHATFKHSLKMDKHLTNLTGIVDNKLIICALNCADTEQARNDEYCPFISKNELIKTNPDFCEKFADFFIYQFKPLIEKNYRIKKNAANSFVYGSSMSATFAMYLAYNYSNQFGGVGCFSNCSFLYENEFGCFMKSKFDPNISLFIYAGACEKMEGYNSEVSPYVESARGLYKLYRDFGCTRLKYVEDENGMHNEESWENAIEEFFKFVL